VKRIYFYATKNDLLPALAAMEADCSVKYGAAGMSLQPVVQQWRQGSELPNLGTANGNQQVTCDAFLIFSADSELGIRSSVMFDGRTRYDVDQISHPESVVFTPAGYWKDGSIIEGSLTTLSNTVFAQEVMRKMLATMRKSFVAIRSSWVGREALSALWKGVRLTTAIRSPREFDLRQENRPV
jgi:hypothetical protein